MKTQVKKMTTDFTGDDMKAFTYHLMNSPLYLPDLIRNYDALVEGISRRLIMPCAPLGVYSPTGKIGGVFWLTDIVPDHDARLMAWVWDKGVCTPETLHTVRDIIEADATTYSLRRVSAQTACPNMERILRMLGMTTEGRQKYGFKHSGKYYTLTLMRKIMDRKG